MLCLLGDIKLLCVGNIDRAGRLIVTVYVNMYVNIIQIVVVILMSWKYLICQLRNYCVNFVLLFPAFWFCLYSLFCFT